MPHATPLAAEEMNESCIAAYPTGTGGCSAGPNPILPVPTAASDALSPDGRQRQEGEGTELNASPAITI